MRQAAYRHNRQTTQWPNMILFIILLLLLAGCAVLYRMNVQKAASVPTPQELLAEKMALAVQNSMCSLVIEENGPGYRLRFEGQMVDGKVYGSIPDFNIEVFAAAEKVFIRKNAKDWEEVGSTDLQALPVFVRHPYQLLEVLLSEQDCLIEEGKQRMVDDISCQTYMLEVPYPELQFLTHFDKEAFLEKVTMYLWFAEDGGFLHRIAIMMNVKVEGEQFQINRIYHLKADQSSLPDDLPNIYTTVTPI